MPAPWLSVIVPTYNAGGYLAEALAGVAAQADPGVEVIAVDDGSTDGTPAVLASYASRLNLTVVSRRVGNWADNSNHGLRLARGTYACFLHQDDVWRPGRLAAVRRQLAATPDVALQLHACRFINPAGRDLGRWSCPYSSGRLISAAKAVERLLIQNFVGIPGAVFRRDLAVELGGLDEGLWYTADWDLWLKLAAAGSTVYLPRPLAGFRLHPGSQTAARSHSLDDFRHQYEAVHARHAARWAAPSATIRESVTRANRAAVEVNVALAAGYHRRPVSWGRLAAAFAALNAADWRRFTRDSRLWERASARVRAGFLTRSAGSRGTGQ
jgi:glycosyltransferase involved in cell wall biosynthesis